MTVIRYSYFLIGLYALAVSSLGITISFQHFTDTSITYKVLYHKVKYCSLCHIRVS